jgi:hypothetical protein
MTTTSHAEAERLLGKGFKLCVLHPNSKRPMGDGWNLNPVTAIDPDAGGYGVMLAKSGLCSLDPDNVGPAREGLQRCGFDLGDLMHAGARTSSTRPGSGGRSTFQAAPNIRWLKFSSKKHGTILELRAVSDNLQDCLPGTVYRTVDGSGPFEQQYANGRTLDEAPPLPPDLLAWWERMSVDVDFLREQQLLLCGPDAQLSVSSGDGSLAFPSHMRQGFNVAHDVTDFLERHNYTCNARGRWAPSTAGGAPCVRLIPGKKDLWQSDHASDPLSGTFDAWTAFVVLDHNGDLTSAETAYAPVHAAAVVVGFDDGLPPAVNEPEQWPAFKRSVKGEILATKNNLMHALLRPDICGFHLRDDKFRGEVMLAENGTEGWRSLKDTDYTKICLQLEDGMCGFQGIGKELIRDGIAHSAELNTFDAAQHWLNALPWDGVARIERFMPVYFGADDTPYTRAVSLYLWTALAGRVTEPGVKCDMVPVAVGAQGMRKSSAVAALVPADDFYIAIDIGGKDDDLARLMRGKLVIELDELKGLGARDSEHIKSFISRTYEEWIPKYFEMNTRYRRRSVFFGTSNKDDFLADETGNRRWLPFRCGMCDPDAIARDRDQLWAEARELFKVNGVLHREAERLAKDEHASFVETDEWDTAVQDWLHLPDFITGRTPYGREFLTSRDVLKEAFHLDDAHQTRPHMLRMKKVLIRLGYAYENKRTGHGRQRGFVPPSLF